MKSSGRDRESSRSGLVVALLLSSLALAGILTWQAQASMRYHRAAAEKVLHDYAMLAADEFARRAANEIGFYGFYPVVTAIRQEAAQGRLVSPSDLHASRDETVQAAADLLRTTFRYEVRSGRLEMLGPEPDPATRGWMIRRFAAEAASPPRDRRYATAHGVVGGRVHSIVFGPAAADRQPGSTLAGFEANDPAFLPRLRKVIAKAGV